VLEELRNTRGSSPVHINILTETIARVTDILGRELDGIAVERQVATAGARVA
jgi:hypothetical protein